jgi:hypothetical protein
VATLPSPEERLTAAREATGLGISEASVRRPPAVCETVARRGGGFTLTVRTAPERMTPDEARATLAVMEEAIARLRARAEAAG